MKNYLLPLLSIICLLIALPPAQAIIAPTLPTTERQKIVDKYGVTNTADFLNLSPREVKKRTGKKLRLKDKIVLRLAQHKVKKALRSGQAVDWQNTAHHGSSNFHLLGFLLGLLLPVVGNIIALFLGRNAFRSSLLGLLISILVGGVIIIV